MPSPPVPPEPIARLARTSTLHRTACGNGHLHWREWGDGEPIVLLHGGFGSWLHWIRNVDALAANRRVLACDLPGLGDSDLPPEPITPESLGAIVAAGLETILDDAPRLHLVGFSFGGLVGGQVAKALADRVATFTLVGASGLGQRRPPMELARRSDDMGEAERATALRQNLLTLMLRHERNADDLALWIHAENDARARLRSRRMSLADSLRLALPHVRAKVRAIWGEHDSTAGPYLPEREALLRELRPELEFHVVPGAGHWVQYEDSEAFDSTLLAILDADA